jgi:polysaccharide export outer membrane protein
VNFSSASPSETQLQERQEQIKDDGTITLQWIGAVPAAGKTPGELQAEIQERYTKFLRNVTVTVKTLQRYYYVTGEVAHPGAVAYVPGITVTKAIAAAGGFTEYANKRKVDLTRPGQKPIRIDCIKAADDPSLDPLVLPNEKVDVKRRFL